MATLWDLINKEQTFTTDDWSLMGLGEIEDEQQITKMLAEGYPLPGGEQK
jgi:hypothetical protein